MKIERFTKIVFVLNCLVPLALLSWDAAYGRLGANPVNFAIRTSGLLALFFLVLSLAVTPASRITGWGWLGQFRRTLGLCAFFHTLLHFFLFFWFDRAANPADTASEILKRPYLMVGAIGLILMTPLAATSTNGMIKRLGPARWKKLHRLAYVAAAAGALHFYMLVKADITRPVQFAAALGSLLLYRLASHYRQLRTDARSFRTAVPPAAVPALAKTWTGQLRVAQVFDETPEVRTFRLVSPSAPRLPFDFLPGQYLNLTLEIDGQKVRRSYTIASSPTRAGYCELTVKREAHGLASRYLHDVIRPGNLLDVRTPAGRFTFTGAEAESVVLIAGGVGITPLMAKIRYLTDLAWSGDIYLVYSARTVRDIVFRDEIDSLRRRHPNLHVVITLTNEEQPNWSGERGRITPAMLTQAVPDISRRRVHMCGPTEMTDAMRQVLRGLGVPDESVFVESFASPSRALTTDVSGQSVGGVSRAQAGALTTNGHAATIEFARSGRSASPAGQTVLEVAEQLQIAINYDCRVGICGQCKTRLLAGQVVMDAEDALIPSDRANKLILACQARCLDQVVVDA